MANRDREQTGVAGLDEILGGGLVPGRAYLVTGGPGTGKTTLGLHFLVAGVARGGKSLCITLGETEAQIRVNAARLGLDLEGIAFLDLSPTPEFFAQVETYDIFSPAEVERVPTTRQIVGKVEELAPDRVFIDAITQFRYLSPDAFQFRKQVLSFLRFLTDRGATVLFSSEAVGPEGDADLRFLADGVIELGFDGLTRFVQVHKFRGSGFRGGRHTMELGLGRMRVFPRLVPVPTARAVALVETIPSGVPELDQLLHGGLERGTVTLITGPSGVGKTTLGLQFVKEAAARGERSVVCLFEESPEGLLARCDAIGVPARAMVEQGTLELVSLEPLLLTADEFAALLRHKVQEAGARIVMVDSIAGYSLTLRGQDLRASLHALAKFLAGQGVTVLLINETEAITGDFRATELGVSYMADNILFLRYLEIKGELRKAIGVLKKRHSDFEKTLREMEITTGGIKVGEPLTNLRGILRGEPEWREPV